MAAMMVVSLKRFPVSFWTMSAGLVFLISAPTVGSKFTR
jgi:hypothetical protein